MVANVTGSVSRTPRSMLRRKRRRSATSQARSNDRHGEQNSWAHHPGDGPPRRSSECQLDPEFVLRRAMDCEIRPYRPMAASKSARPARTEKSAAR